MTSRERILNAINHKESDVIPLDLGATPSSGISAIGYNRLKKELGIEGGRNRVYDVVQQVTQPEDSVIEALGIDVVDIGRTFNTRDEDWREVTLADGSSAEWPAWFKTVNEGKDISYYDEDGDKIARMPDGATFFDQTCFPYLDDYPDDYKDLDKAMSKVLWSKLVHSPWDHAGDPGFWDTLRKNAIELRKNTDKAKEMLSEQDGSLSHISHMVGIEDQSYFTKLFRKYTGTTPMKYRMSSRNPIGRNPEIHSPG